MMMRSRLLLAGFALVAACGGGQKGASDSAGGAAAVAENKPGAAKALAAPAETRFSALGDTLGRIPVLEYHVIGDSNSGMFTISRDQFRRDLKMLYDRGYRPITVAQLLDKDFSDVPPGMSPVVFTFDDASPEQFSYVERDGALEIDPNTAVGMWLDFEKQHPDWKGRATFCLLPGAEAGHAFFGDKPKYRGQKNEWRHQKVKWLADNGFELCNHTLWHAQLSKYPDAFVQEQIARGNLAIDSVVPGYKVRTFALPQGLWPKNRALAWRGSWTEPRTGKTTSYDYETVLEVAGGPTRSPFDPAFDRRTVTRVIAFGKAVQETLDRLDANKTRFVWNGGASATGAR
jgi:peptidoglycan/xylan/chitin deacetylase (PgdA/CDA1 family)